MDQYNKNVWKIINDLKIISLVCVSPRPGVDFLHSLFDFHHQVITFDGWIHFHEFYKNSISINGTYKFILGTSSNKIENRFSSINLKNFFSEFAWGHLHKFDSRYDTLEQKGKFYLAKDAIIDSNHFKSTYPEYINFLKIKKKYDPENLFISEQFKRLFK